MNRTEDQKLTRAGFEVTLGADTIQIEMLRIGKVAAWRAKLAGVLGPLVENFNQQTTGKAMAQGLTGALVQFPDKLLDMLIEYAPNLDRAKIEEEATDEQVAIAFSKVMSVAFPYLAQLGLVTQVVRANQGPVQ